MSYSPRYIRIAGVWYIRKDHVADQLTVAIEQAFAEGMRFAGHEPEKRTRRGPYRLRKPSKLIEGVVT